MCGSCRELLEDSHTEVHLLYGRSELAALDGQLYFHALDLMSGEATSKRPDIVRNAVNSTLASMTVLFMQMDWAALTKFFHLSHCGLWYCCTGGLILRRYSLRYYLKDLIGFCR